MIRELLSTALVFLTLTSASLASENSLKSVLGIPFGDICVIKAEFVDKSNDYYSQNVSTAEYFLKIIEINDRKLSEPLIVEPSYGNLKVQKNKLYNFKAFETINSKGEPRGWTDEVQQIDYEIIHKVVIKEQ